MNPPTPRYPAGRKPERCSRCALDAGFTYDDDGELVVCDHGQAAAALADVEARDRAASIRHRYDPHGDD